ncbi:MAG: EsaB/YukD family protein, partial [Myxococcota bacterium]|nr:EsaB/YukD family protein [Myxococcota bacterium]
MHGAPQQPQVQQTVRVRVQVIDLESFTLDLIVPTYLPARDLTQRVARDAGLEAYWPDGRRRLYWLRARGRLLGDEDKLEQLGVVDGELVYLLPEPPSGSGVVEQTPDHPENRGYAGKGVFALLGSISSLI